MSSRDTNVTRIPRKTQLNPLAPFSTTKPNYSTTTAAYTNKSKQRSTHHHSAHSKVDKLSSWSRRSPEASVKEDNVEIRSSLHKLEEDHKKMKETLEATVKYAEEKLEYMKTLMEKSNQIHIDEVEKLSSKNQVLEEHIEEYEKKLIKSNFNSVTLEDLPSFEAEEVDDSCIEKRQKISKSKLKAIKDKLHDMNIKTQSYLDDAEAMKREIEDLEGMSLRIVLVDEDVLNNKYSSKQAIQVNQTPKSQIFFITERE